MEKPYYVILTGSKNNAGDFLIKYRAKELFKKLRKDREVVDLDGWKRFDKHSLDLVNRSQALILTGGPALQKKTIPNVYGIGHCIDQIKVPIITMGIGWHSPVGTWKHTHRYDLNNETLKLFSKINSSGHLSSVRDYHTKNVLDHLGFNNFLITGCPGLYEDAYMDKRIETKDIVRVGFSLGVALKYSNSMFKQAQEVLLGVAEVLPKETKFDVAFHHALDDRYLKAHGAAKQLYLRNLKFAKWLKSTGISYTDISGSAENLIEYYSKTDLHIGYRVHAHIFMSSISKPSLLLSEDGRGVALKDVIGGCNIQAYESCRTGLVSSAINKLRIPYDDFVPAEGLVADVKNILSYELSHGVKFSEARININNHFKIMESFISQLP